MNGDQQNQQQSDHPLMPQEARGSRAVHTLVWAVVIIVIGVIIGVVAFRNAGLHRTEIAPGQELVQAQEGSVVPGFPRELLPRVVEPVVAESFAIEYRDENRRQPVVRYTSGQALEDTIDTYRSILFDNGWDIRHEPDPSELPVVFFYAVRGDEEVNVTFVVGEEAEPISVQVSYASDN